MKYILFCAALLVASDVFAKSRKEPSSEDIGILMDHVRLSAIYDKCAPKAALAGSAGLTTATKFIEARDNWPDETYKAVRSASEEEKLDIKLRYRCARSKWDINDLRSRLGLIPETDVDARRL